MSICKILIAALVALSMSNEAIAGSETYQVPDSTLTNSSILPDSIASTHQHFKISYRVNRTEIDTAYMDNKASIRKMRLALSGALGIDSIVIYSFASPEGSLKNNLRLARERGRTSSELIHQILREKHVDIPEDRIKLRTRGENWGDLYSVIERTYKGEDRDQVLEILTSDMPRWQQKSALKCLGKKTWSFIVYKLMPHLRCSEIVCIYHANIIPSKLEIPVVQVVSVPETPMVHTEPLQDILKREPVYEYEKRTMVAAKTNMLYDAVTWTNFSIEVPFKIKDSKFSITYDHQFPWWRVGEGNNKYCNRYLQIGGEARWWFAPQTKPRTKKNIKRECLAGHFAGLYGMGGKYDFEWGRHICYQGEFWSAGLTYGYSMPISRVFNLEFSVSLGYASIDYRHFTPSEDYDVLYRDYDKMGRLDYFGITKLGVSLVLPLNFKHKVKGKEADR